MVGFKNSKDKGITPLEILEREYCRLMSQPYPITEMVFVRSWMLFRVSHSTRNRTYVCIPKLTRASSCLISSRSSRKGSRHAMHGARPALKRHSFTSPDSQSSASWRARCWKTRASPSSPPLSYNLSKAFVFALTWTANPSIIYTTQTTQKYILCTIKRKQCLTCQRPKKMTSSTSRSRATTTDAYGLQLQHIH